jgi:hypothetical protein
MKDNPFCIPLLIVLSAFPSFGAPPEAAPAAVPPPAKTEIQIQGGAQIRIQVAPQPAAAADPAAAKEARPGYLGVQLDQTPAGEIDEAEPKEKGKKNGVGIVSVIEDSPGAKAGLKDGDQVLIFEGKEAKDSNQLREMVRAAKAGTAVKLTVRRGEKEIEIKATLGAAPENPLIFQLGGQQGADAVPGVVVFNRFQNMAQGDAETTAGVGATAASSALDVVSLRDGNRFTGSMQSFDPEKGLLLHREGAPNVELLESGIESLTFATRTKGALLPGKVNLQLRDGSWFGGDALTMEEGKISLTLPGGQQLLIPREQARLATLSDGPAPQIYDGPINISGWTSGRSGQGVWDYRDGFLRCLTNGAIGRNVERMPDPLDLSFDVFFPLHLQHFSVSLFSNGLNQTSAGSLSVQFNPQQVHANHFDGRRYNQYNVELKPADGPNAGKPANRRYRLLVDRVNGKVLVYINGVKQAAWDLSKVKPEDIAKCGSYLSFSPNVFMSNQNFQIGRIRLLPWDGKEPANGVEPADPGGDQVLSAKGGGKDGQIDRISESEILFGNGGGVVPREKTLYVRFAAPPVPPAELPPAVAMLRMKNGGEFGVTLARGDAETMTFTTRAGPPVTLPLSILRDINFLPGPNQPDPSAGGLDILTLTSGAQMRGTFVTPMSGDALRWKIMAAKAPLEFPWQEVAGIYFAAAKAPQDTPVLEGSSAARFINGDWLPGKIVSMDARQLVLKTTLSQELAFPLDTLRSLYVSPAVTASLSDGATGRELWNRGWNPNRVNMSKDQLEVVSKMQESWSYHDGTYALTGTTRNNSAGLGRRWPAYTGAYALNFEIENPSSATSFHIQLFDANEQRTFTIYSFGSRLNVYFNPASGKFNRFMGGTKQFQVDDSVRAQGKTLRMTMVLDRPARAFRLLYDGKEIGKIAFKEEEAQEALSIGGMIVMPMGGGQQSRIGNIWFAPWEGASAKTFDGAEKREPAKDPAAQPILYLANGDEFAGKIEGVNADLMTVNSEAGSLELPLQRVAWLHFPSPTAAPSVHFPRLRFNDRGVLSVKHLLVENDRVKCQTLQGQALDFPLSLVKEIVYRPVR